MSDERHSPDEPMDAVVSRAYRTLADECAPGHLDHIVLNQARRAAHPAGAKTAAWLRPLAWVAMVGLCLAIVLEVTDVARQEQPVFDEDFDGVVPAAVESTPAEEAPAAPPAATRKDAAAAIEVEAVEAGDLKLLRDAENRARLQSGSDEPVRSLQLPSLPEVGVAGDVPVARYCDETQTADPHRWLECILDLEQQGLHDAARVERELLAEAFPPSEPRR